MSLLEVVGLTTEIRLRRATVHAVQDVSLTVDAGETVGLVGESGCGKTITGMSIMGLLPHGGYTTAGQIRFGGRDLVTADRGTMRRVRGNEIGMVFQDPMTSLNPTMTIGRQIAETVQLHRGASKAAAMERAVEVLALVGMPKPRERIDDYPHHLSGGLRQRVMIAMALACEPKLLIADEPTTALDVTIQAQILRLLDELKAELGMAMILITHDLGVIAGRADRVMVMYAGQIVESGDAIALFAGMRHPYTEALLASIPKPDQDTTTPLSSIPGRPPDLTVVPSACHFAPRCPYATGECWGRIPPFTAIDPGHLFACFHPRPARAGPATEGHEAASDTEPRPVAARTDSRPESIKPDVILELRHVSKDFAVTSGAVLQRRIGTVQAVSDVTLSVRRGETLGLVGESGCGKTTLGQMVVALQKPTVGQVLFEGTDLDSLRQGRLSLVRRDLQIVFQDPYASLDPRMRIGSIVAEPLTVQHVGDRNARRRRVAELLEEVGLPPTATGRYPHEFSGGQRQRIALARALALQPKLIVADEPVSALDVSIRSQILNLMRRLQIRHGLTYVLISHDLSVVRYLADRVAVMYLGKVVEIGTAGDIYSRAAHPYTAGLLASIPVPDPVVERAKKAFVIEGELPSARQPPSGCRFRTRCPRAQDRCAVEAPELTSFGAEHAAACHFPLQQPVVLTSTRRSQ